MEQATKLHENISEEFNAAYREKESFRRRYVYWKKLIEDNLDKTNKALDLGCGPGWMTGVLADHFDNVIAVDGASSMIDIAKENLSAKGNIEFVKSHIDQKFISKTINKKFDLIICSSLLEYLKDIEEILSSMKSILHMDAKLIFSLPNKSCMYRLFEKALYKGTGMPNYRAHLINELTRDEIQHILNVAGYRVLKLEYQGYIPYFSSIASSLMKDKYAKPMMVVICEKS